LHFNDNCISPFFELEALDACGIGNVGNWRNTIIIEMQLLKKTNFRINRDHIDNWRRFRFGNKVASLKVDVKDKSKITAKPPYSDGFFTLKTVSSRDNIRRTVNFITSRNKALYITGTAKVEVFLNTLENTKSLLQALNNEYTESEIQNLKLIYSLIGI
jgi:hypothetical protein